MHSSHSSQRGYSLPEALVVIAIIGILTMVAVPAFITMYRSNQLKVSARQFAGDARWARQKAVTTGKPVKITFGAGANARNYNIYELDGATWSATAIRNGVLSEGTYISSTTFGDIDDAPADPTVPVDDDDDNDLVFKPDGTAWNAVETTNRVVVASTYPIAKTSFDLVVRPSGNMTIY